MNQTKEPLVHARVLSETPVQIKLKMQRRDLLDGESAEADYTMHGMLRKAVVGVYGDGCEDVGTQLCYREPPQTGLPNTQTVLTFHDRGLVTLERSGDINCCWLFDPEHVMTCSYEVGLLRAEMNITAELMDNQLLDDCGYAALEYQLNTRGERNYTWNRMEYAVTPLCQRTL